MLSQNLKNIRKNKGFTQEELACRLHVARQTISKWEKGYSVPDAQVLSEMADIFEVSVAELLGAEGIKNAENDALIEQLSRINEQLAIKNRRARRIWKTIIIVILAFVIMFVSFAAIGFVSFNSDSNKEAGMTAWDCYLNGEVYSYQVTYNKNFQILTGGGDAYLSNHISLDQYDDANELAAHLHDYIIDRGGKIKVIAQDNLKLNE